ncbi:MAG: excisionase family DNA-binding protein [Actinomycetota bacterium]
METPTLQPDQLLTVAEAAEILGTTDRFPRRLIAEGRIAYIKLGEGRNGHVRIKLSVLQSYIESSTIEAAE